MKKIPILKRLIKKGDSIIPRIVKEKIPLYKRERIEKWVNLLQREIRRPSRIIALIIGLILIYLVFSIGSSRVNRLAIQGKEVNILLLGTDSTGTKGCTDTILLIRYQPKTQHLRILSIPRDTLVIVFYQGKKRLDKINHVYSRGGVKLLLNLLEKSLKEDIPFYAIVDYAGFRNMVDIVGGIEVYVSEHMKYTDRAGGLYINIPPGLQKLDGEKVLQYVRYRSNMGDIGRIERQQEIIKLFIEKLTQSDNQILTSSKVLRELKEHLLTNFSLSDIVSLALHLKKLDLQKISILKAQGEPYWVKGRAYWQMDWDQIRAQWQPLPQNETLITSPEEIIKVRILNGCGKKGASKDLQHWLRKDKNIDVLEIGRADRFTYEETLILDQVGKKENASYVKMVLGFGRVYEKIDPEVLVDVTIIIGKDFLGQKKRGGMWDPSR